MCILFLFCAAVILGSPPNEPGKIAQFPQAPNVYTAHNYFIGDYFDEIKPGQIVHVADGDQWAPYRVTEVLEAQALNPDSLTTDLWIEGAWRPPAWVHDHVFEANDLVLFTCIERAGLVSWGRLMVLAERLE